MAINVIIKIIIKKKVLIIKMAIMSNDEDNDNDMNNSNK